MSLFQVAVWILVTGVSVEGVWLAGLTYLMWKRNQDREDEPTDPSSGTPA